jgi:hypothetical protein
MIKDATDSLLQERLEGLEYQYLIEDSLLSLLFCDYTGDLQENKPEKDIANLRVHHVLETLIEKTYGAKIVLGDKESREARERLGLPNPHQKTLWLQMIDGLESWRSPKDKLRVCHGSEREHFALVISQTKG